MVFPEHSGTAAGSRHGRNLEGAMSLSTEHEMPQLPKRLPAGSVYVVEGRVGRHGNLRVSSRYLVMPSGEKVKFPMELAAKHPVGAGSRRLFGRDSRPSSRTKEFSRGNKKICSPPRNKASEDTLSVRRRAKPPSPSPSITRRRTPAALAVGVLLF